MENWALEKKTKHYKVVFPNCISVFVVTLVVCDRGIEAEGIIHLNMETYSETWLYRGIKRVVTGGQQSPEIPGCQV